VQALPAGLKQPKQFLADIGCFSADNVAADEQAGIAPLIAVKRDHHHPHWAERFNEPPGQPIPFAPLGARAKG
jgi:hypothetical protein